MKTYLAVFGGHDNVHAVVTFLEHVLVVDGLNVSHAFLVGGELLDVFDEILDDFGVTLSEGRHQARHLAIVLAVDIGSGADELLHHFEMTSWRRRRRRRRRRRNDEGMCGSNV